MTELQNKFKASVCNIVRPYLKIKSREKTRHVRERENYSMAFKRHSSQHFPSVSVLTVLVCPPLSTFDRKHS